MRERKSMAAYMYEACQAGHMPPEREAAMLQAIQDGREAKSRLAQGGTESDNSAALREAARYGEECRAMLAIAYLPTLVLFARRYSYTGVPMEDLVQEATVGMLEALDSNKANSLNLAAAIHVQIKHALHRIISQQNAVRFPPAITAAIRKIKRVSECLANDSGTAPQAEDVAGEMAIPPAIARQLMQYHRVSAAASLDAPLNDEEGGITLADLFCSEELTPEDVAERESLRTQILEILETLEPIEASTIKLRFGFVGEALDARETAQELKIPMDLEQKTEIRALRKLRHPSRSKFLEDYLYD